MTTKCTHQEIAMEGNIGRCAGCGRAVGLKGRNGWRWFPGENPAIQTYWSETLGRRVTVPE